MTTQLFYYIAYERADGKLIAGRTATRPFANRVIPRADYFKYLHSEIQGCIYVDLWEDVSKLVHHADHIITAESPFADWVYIDDDGDPHGYHNPRGYETERETLAWAVNDYLRLDGLGSVYVARDDDDEAIGLLVDAYPWVAGMIGNKKFKEDIWYVDGEESTEPMEFNNR